MPSVTTVPDVHVCGCHRKSVVVSKEMGKLWKRNGTENRMDDRARPLCDKWLCNRLPTPREGLSKLYIYKPYINIYIHVCISLTFVSEVVVDKRVGTAAENSHNEGS